MILRRAVTELTAFDRGEVGGEGSEEQRCHHPEGQLVGAASRTIGSGLGFGDHSFTRFSASIWFIRAAKRRAT
jgi:hypothetical protein